MTMHHDAQNELYDDIIAKVSVKKLKSSAHQWKMIVILTKKVSV